MFADFVFVRELLPLILSMMHSRTLTRGYPTARGLIYNFGRKFRRSDKSHQGLTTVLKMHWQHYCGPEPLLAHVHL